MLLVCDDGGHQAYAALCHVHDKAARAGNGALLALLCAEVAPRLLEVGDRRVRKLGEQVGVEELLGSELRVDEVALLLAEEREAVAVEVGLLPPAQELARAVEVSRGRGGRRLRNTAELVVEVGEEELVVGVVQRFGRTVADAGRGRIADEVSHAYERVPPELGVCVRVTEHSLEAFGRERAEGTPDRAAQRQLEHQGDVRHELGVVRHRASASSYLPVAPVPQAWVVEGEVTVDAHAMGEEAFLEVAVPHEGLRQLAVVAFGEPAQQHERCGARVDVEPRRREGACRVGKVRVMELMVESPAFEESLERGHRRGSGWVERSGPACLASVLAAV